MLPQFYVDPVGQSINLIRIPTPYNRIIPNPQTPYLNIMETPEGGNRQRRRNRQRQRSRRRTSPRPRPPRDITGTPPQVGVREPNRIPIRPRTLKRALQNSFTHNVSRQNSNSNSTSIGFNTRNSSISRLVDRGAIKTSAPQRIRHTEKIRPRKHSVERVNQREMQRIGDSIITRTRMRPRIREFTNTPIADLELEIERYMNYRRELIRLGTRSNTRNRVLSGREMYENNPIVEVYTKTRVHAEPRANQPNIGSYSAIAAYQYNVAQILNQTISNLLSQISFLNALLVPLLMQLNNINPQITTIDVQITTLQLQVSVLQMQLSNLLLTGGIVLPGQTPPPPNPQIAVLQSQIASLNSQINSLTMQRLQLIVLQGQILSEIQIIDSQLNPLSVQLQYTTYLRNSAITLRNVALARAIGNNDTASNIIENFIPRTFFSTPNFSGMNLRVGSGINMSRFDTIRNANNSLARTQDLIAHNRWSNTPQPNIMSVVNRNLEEIASFQNANIDRVLQNNINIQSGNDFVANLNTSVNNNTISILQNIQSVNNFNFTNLQNSIIQHQQNQFEHRNNLTNNLEWQNQQIDRNQVIMNEIMRQPIQLPSQGSYSPLIVFNNNPQLISDMTQNGRRNTVRIGRIGANVSMSNLLDIRNFSIGANTQAIRNIGNNVAQFGYGFTWGLYRGLTQANNVLGVVQTHLVAMTTAIGILSGVGAIASGASLLIGMTAKSHVNNIAINTKVTLTREMRAMNAQANIARASQPGFGTNANFSGGVSTPDIHLNRTFIKGQAQRNIAQQTLLAERNRVSNLNQNRQIMVNIRPTESQLLARGALRIEAAQSSLPAPRRFMFVPQRNVPVSNQNTAQEIIRTLTGVR